MIEAGQVYGDAANLRTLKIVKWSDHFKDENGQCSCRGNTCKPDQISGLRRIGWKVKTLLNKSSRCACGNLKCRFVNSHCTCEGYNCPFLSMAIVEEKQLTKQGIRVRAMAMPTARFSSPKRGYTLLVDETAINRFFLNCAAERMLTYIPEKVVRG